MDQLLEQLAQHNPQTIALCVISIVFLLTWWIHSVILYRRIDKLRNQADWDVQLNGPTKKSKAFYYTVIDRKTQKAIANGLFSPDAQKTYERAKRLAIGGARIKDRRWRDRFKIDTRKNKNHI